MKRINGWKKGLAFTFALALAAAPLTANVQGFSVGRLMSASAAEEVSENEAILAYLKKQCTSKNENENVYEELLFSEKALSVFKSGEETYKLTDSLRGVTAKGNTNSNLFMRADDYQDELSFCIYRTCKKEQKKDEE